MTDVVLVYPYFQPRRDRSPFRFPPLGLGYIASYLRNHGLSVGLVDCTFMSEDEVKKQVRRLSPSIIGIYSMFSMKKTTIELAHTLKNEGLDGRFHLTAKELGGATIGQDDEPGCGVRPPGQTQAVEAEGCFVSSVCALLKSP